MNILCLSYEYPPLGGGGAAVVEGVCGQLTKRGSSIDLVTMGYRDLNGTENSGALQVHRLRTGRLRQHMCSALEMIPYVLRGFLRARKICRTKKVDVIHAHFIFPDGVIAAALSKATGIPYVITVHGSDVPGYNPDRFKALHRLLRPLWRKAVYRAYRIVCPSAFLESLLKREGPASKTVIIPNGIDVNRFSSHRPRVKRILVVTRIFERKGVQDLLHACKDIDPSWEVVIVGDGPYLPSLKAISERLGREVRFTGFLPNKSAELTELFETSSIFVLPSYAENFPVSLLEAMDAGLAIVTTQGTGCAEVVGDAAMLVQPGDVDGLKEHSEHLTRDTGLRQQLGEAARRRVESSYSWERVGHLYEEVLSSAAALNSVQRPDMPS
jgi:glycosyltransferase involved in cell wall biosynthesis